jgi:AraC-like DNA-binding protein
LTNEPPPSTLQDCSRNIVFVPAGYAYHDWHKPRTLSRVVFFYVNPTQLAMTLEPRHCWQSTPPSVTEVSGSVGYNDISAFNAAFRRVTGLTPRADRRNIS